MFNRIAQITSVLASCVLLLAACGGGGSSRNIPPTSPPPPSTIVDADFDLAAFQVPGAPVSDGTATADLTINLDDGDISGVLSVNGITAVEVRLNEGFAGQIGTLIAALTDNGSGEWAIPDGTVLSAGQLTLLDQGGIFIEVTTADNPEGVLRGQIVLGNQQIFVNVLSGEQEIPPVASAASAFVGVTLNPDDGSVVVHVTADGLDNAVAAHVHQAFAGTNGGVIVELEQDANDVAHWLAPADIALDEAGLDALNNGELYLNVHTPAVPAGEIRGQLIPDGVDLFSFPLTGGQSVPAVVSAGSANAAVTYNRSDSTLAANINTVDLDVAVAAHVHSGLAGDTGPVELEFEQDATEASRWSIAGGTVVSEVQRALLADGALYVNLHTPANPAGEVRGQIVPAGIEVLFTTLLPADVVPASASTGTGIAATTIAESTHTMNTNVNLVDLDDANGVRIHQAPVMQNGPELFSLTQDATDAARWRLVDQMLDDGTYLALRNQGLYVQATSPGLPDGAVRGQLEPAISDPSPANAFSVVSTAPANGASDEAPTTLTINFNRAPLAGSVDGSQFELLASGGDANFNSGNETMITLPAPDLDGASIRFDISGTTLDPDTYQLRVDPDDGATLTDSAGVVLDGDGDGNAGGDFVATFEVQAAAPPAATLTQLQTEIFSPSCATLGCHSGGAPAAGMNLSDGMMFSNTVNVASGQNGALDRVEPGDPDNSYLVQKVEGTAAAGNRMPLGQPALSNDLIQSIRSWIADGAQDN